jgi:N-acetylglucosaminyldiphosphoundecaprenol N-acetyl-beta-D-mannosaminyltransferase
MIRKNILDTLITIGSFSSFIEKVFLLVDTNLSTYVCVCNVHMLMKAKRDAEYRKVLKEADVITPDGMPIVKVLSWKYSIQQDRVSGMDLMPRIIKECAKFGKSVYLYGPTDDVLENIKKRINSDFPFLEVDLYSPPFRELSALEDDEICKKINDFNPDFVFVALGCPKQEKWMAKHKGKINSCMIGLGGAFPVYAGLQKRAPKWMCDNSLEWLYRLILEPRRLFGRYFVTNTLFILYICIDYLQSKFNK